MAWIARRIVVSLGLLLVVVSAVFLSIHIIPGDPAEVLLSAGGVLPDPESVAALRHTLGLDRPVHEQYLDAMAGFLTGDLGVSMQDGASVGGQIARRLPNTIELILASTLFAVTLGVPVGVFVALRRDGWVDRVSGWFSAVALSLPVFVIGTVFVLIFAQRLRLVPAGGYVPFSDDPLRHLGLLAMPAVAIGLSFAAEVMRMTRTSVLDVAHKDYVRTARAKGLAERTVLREHVLINAIPPILTIVAMNMGSLLGGTVLAEHVFNWPGMSTLLLEAVDARDYPMVVGCIAVISTVFIGINFAVDILYGVLDPRVRKQ